MPEKPPANPNIVKIRSGFEIDKTDRKFEGPLMRVKKRGERGWGIFIIKGVDCVGVINEPNVGAYYTLTGVWAYAEKYNKWDFKFSAHEEKLDAKHGLKEFLTREGPNVGSTVAINLVKIFGSDVIKIAAKGLAELNKIPGMSYEQRVEFHTWAKKELGNAQIKEKLYGIGLLPALVNRLIRHFGNDAENRIRVNCFALTEIDGIGFKTVAAIADLLGIPADDPGRIKAGLLHAIDELYDEGHTCIKRNDLLREACALMALNHVQVDAQLEVLIAEGKMMTENSSLADYARANGVSYPD